MTFDDGPHPDSTPFILQKLKTANVKATFFCLGKNVSINKHLFEVIKSAGHTIGNHGFQHLDGWVIPFDEYIKNVKIAAQVIKSPLFRPPYGRLTFRPYRYLKRKFKIILWDIMPGDFDSKTLNINDKGLNFKIRPGSIIVLHDNPKYLNNTLKILDYVIERHKGKFTFEAIPINYEESSEETYN